MNRMRITLRQRLKPLAGRLGLSSSLLWRRVALAAYRQKKERDQGYREWVEGLGRPWISDHWVTLPIQDEFTREHTASQLYEVTRLLKVRLETLGYGGGRVLDAGASDGSFLALLGIRCGVGLNFLRACARRIRADGHSAVQADIEWLPFRDRSFAQVICCETLEHVPNPVAALNELGRVSQGRVMLSIPWLPRTRVTARPPGWPQVESHIFEFSEPDFRKMVTHSCLTIRFSGSVPVFPEPQNPALRWWLRQWMYPSYFPRLQYYELEPV